MKQVDNISVTELKKMADKMYGSFVKGVVDVEKKTVVLDAEMHVDEEQMLLEQGSKQTDLWGFNLYPENYDTDDFIEFDSMINLRPSQNNPSRSVLDTKIQKQIRDIVGEVVHE